MVITGELRCEGTLELQGCIDGDIQGETVLIRKTGKITGRIHAHKVVCHGVILGEVDAREVVITKGGVLSGELITSSLDMQFGAVLDGETTITTGTVRKPGKSRLSSEATHKAERAKVDLVSLFAEIAAGQRGFFAGANRGTTLAMITTELAKGTTIVLTTAPAGYGKTAMSLELAQALSGSCRVVTLQDPAGSVKDICAELARGLGWETLARKGHENIVDEVKSKLKGEKKPVVLVVDNGESMYPATLEGLVNHLAGFAGEDTLLQLALFATAELKGKFAPKMAEYFAQRPQASLELSPLTEAETIDYIDFRLKHGQIAGEQCRTIFPEKACRALHRDAQGSVAEINRLAALLLQKTQAQPR